METHFSFVPLLIVFLLAFLVPLALSRFKRLRLPVVVGEILAGIAIGKSGLGWVDGHDPVLEILGLLGFAYLMYLSGLEVDFEAVLPKSGTLKGSWKDRISNPLGIGSLSFLLTLGFGLMAAFLLTTVDAADDPWLAALILSTTSLGLVMPVLKERGLTSKPYGQALLIAAVIADFATMLLVSVYFILHTQGLSLDILLVLILFGAFLTAYRIAAMARKRFPGVDFVKNIGQASAQLDVRGAFAIGLAFIALAQGLGVELILGAFLGGALISLLAGRGAYDLRHRLEVIGFAFFIPIFFIMVGVNFDVSALFSSPQALLLVPLLLVLAYGIKFVASLVFRLGFSWRETLGAGALLSSRLSLIIAVSAIGLQMGAIDSATNSAIILVAIVTSTVSPLLFVRIVPDVPDVVRRFVIAGAGQQAQLLAGRILGNGQDVVLIDDDTSCVSTAEEKGLPVIRADPREAKTWQDLDPETIRAVAVLLADDEANMEASWTLREDLFVEQRIVSVAHDSVQAAKFVELDVHAVNPSLSPIVELEYLMLYPSVSSLISDLDDEHDVAEVRLRNPELTGTALHDLELPEGALIILIRRETEVIYPRGNVRLEIGDRLTLMGPLESVRELSRWAQS